MENQGTKWPLYVIFSQIMVGTFAFFYILYIGQEILIPLAFALIISILLNPAVKFLTKKGINKVLSIIICITLLILLVSAICFFVASQISLLSDSLPEFKQKFDVLINDLEDWTSKAFNISRTKLDNWVVIKRQETVGSADEMIGGALTTIGGIFILIFLIPVYVFMFLFYKPLLLDFVAQIFRKETHCTVAEVLTSMKSLIQNYLIGLLIEFAIMATSNSLVLLIIGVDYAILFGIVGAFLNLIPYIGGIIAMALPMLMAFLNQSPMTAFAVMIAYLIVQIIDNNYIIPKIVASKVKINALVSMVVVLVGGGLWGLAGMFLSIPITGIVKVVFDKMVKLKPLGFLIGDTMPPIGSGIFNFQLNKSKEEKKD